jgi:cytochrome P450
MKRVEVGSHTVQPGEFYNLSSYFTHRSEKYWSDGDSFDPSRWTKGCPMKSGAYVPFGWSIRSCPGASVGTMMLMLFARLFVRDLRIDLAPDAAPYMRFEGTPLPGGFVGTIQPR